jgi:glycerol-3-phosphate dehydrogenase
MAAVESRYPSLALTLDDVLATFAGVRPVINTGKADPSAESRDHVVWTGKRPAHRDRRQAHHLPPHRPGRAESGPGRPARHAQNRRGRPGAERGNRRFARTSCPKRCGGGSSAGMAWTRRRWWRRPSRVSWSTIPNTNVLWAELRWAARSEGVVHLDDLLLRRVRLGLLLAAGRRRA